MAMLTTAAIITASEVFQFFLVMSIMIGVSVTSSLIFITIAPKSFELSEDDGYLVLDDSFGLE